MYSRVNQKKKRKIARVVVQRVKLHLITGSFLWEPPEQDNETKDDAMLIPIAKIRSLCGIIEQEIT
jgi:hypothetical protein